MKATAQMGGLTRQEIEAFRRIAKQEFAGVRVDQVCDLALQALETPADEPYRQYRQGFEDGIRAYAWYKDGVQQVGTTGRTLRQALTDVEKTWNYSPPTERP